MNDNLKVIIQGWYATGPQILLSIVAVAIILEKFYNLARAKTDGHKLMDSLKEAIRKRDFNGAIGYCRATPGPVAKVLANTIELRSLTTEEVKHGVEESVLTEVPRLERFLPTLATVITLEPLLGLFGTITGLMKVFEQFAYVENPNPMLLASGIKEALLTTVIGLATAIIFYIFQSIISAKIDKVINQMEQSVVALINFMRLEGVHGNQVQEKE